jgi:hypothetical protein
MRSIIAARSFCPSLLVGDGTARQGTCPDERFDENLATTPRLSARDAVHIAAMQARDVGWILSFDGVRQHPGDRPPELTGAPRVRQRSSNR